jgi:hypothetical protein
MIAMICFAKPAKRTLDEKPSIFIRDNPIFSSDRMLHKVYDRKGSVEIISGREYEGACRQDERIGSKPAVVK